MTWTIRHDTGGFPLRWSESYAQQSLQAGYWRQETLGDIARRQTESNPDKVLLIEGANQLTRQDIFDAALRVAQYFLAQGARPGDVVSYQLPNWSESAVITLAARLTGLVINPIPPIYRETELRYMLEATGAKFLFIPREFRRFDFLQMVGEIKAELPKLQNVVVLRGDADGETAWESTLAYAPAEQLPTVNPADAFMIMFTSGTTGRAKGVIQTHYGFGYKARQMAEAWHVNEDDVVFMPSPVSHITGAIWAFDIPWLTGAPAVLLDVWDVNDGIEAIQKHGCTISGGATPFLQQLLNATADDRSALSSLRTFFCGGTSVAPELIRQVSAVFPDCLFFRAYGSTEVMTVTLGISSKADARWGAETDGIVLPPVSVKLVNDEGREINGQGVEGEVLAFGPEQFAGYLDPADNEGAFDEQGYFRMGDLGRWVNGNYLEITGRKKDIIIRSGENISPKEVEDVLAQHPAIAEVAVVAMPSVVTGEMGCAFVILKPGQSFEMKDLLAFLNQAGLAKQKFPEHLEVVEDFPRVPSGKVRKDALREIANNIAKQVAERIVSS